MEVLICPRPHNGEGQARPSHLGCPWDATQGNPLHPDARWLWKHLLSWASGLNNFLQSGEVPEYQRICRVCARANFHAFPKTPAQHHTRLSPGEGGCPSWQPGDLTPGSASFCHPRSLSVMTSKFTTCSLMTVPGECDRISLPLSDKRSSPPYPAVLNQGSLQISQPRVFVPPPLPWKASPSLPYSKVR